MPSRRHFIAAIATPALAAASAASLNSNGMKHALAAIADKARFGGSPEEIARNEDFWFQVSKAFTVDRSLVNLNNGGVSPSTAATQEAMGRHLAYSNLIPPYTMWRILEPQVEGVRQRLAREHGVSAEEIAITRNASEGLQICQFGFDLAKGDEVLATNQDYPRMINTFKQRERREGIVLKQFSIPTPAEDDDEIVALYEKNISKKTRLILVSHMIFLTGQILPVKKVAALGRKYGIPVIIDGAHALAHFDFKLCDLDCDYYATSLHKWLFAPHGTGLLYVRRDKIKGLWPLMAAPEGKDDDIRKFEEIGTHPIANRLAIGEALSFHQGIGAKRKEKRLIYLRDLWAKRLLKRERVQLHTSLKPGFACGIANVEIKGVLPGKLAAWLWKKHKILVSPIKHEEFKGIRISPSVYTTLEEIDRFCSAMEEVMEKGLPEK